ncbi:hypothetical protein [Psychromonas ossibalaenae]|uniref:hypothetical protein n=1 Tax=Psychromonas ossibalaenae TaxID=444922 RepID=UPI000367ECA6|nr:hypothetical protein [Psychromonas ossibalaenae]
MKKITALFAAVLMSVSLFVAPVSALQSNQFSSEQMLYGSCRHVDQANGPELIKCLQSGRGGSSM